MSLTTSLANKWEIPLTLQNWTPVNRVFSLCLLHAVFLLKLEIKIVLNNINLENRTRALFYPGPPAFRVLRVGTLRH